jgi:tol-pal system protein YbgF
VSPRPSVRRLAGRPRDRVRRLAAALAGGAAMLALAALPGCYAPQLAMLRSGLDSLRVVVDTLVVRDSVAYRVLADTRRQIAEQKDVLLSTRATAGTTTQQLFDQMSRLENRLDEVLSRFHEVSQRTTPPATANAAPDPGPAYDQAALDLTSGRYALAIQEFRDFLSRFPTAELADNALYGVGECYFAQAQYDSAAAAYGRVVDGYPNGDRLPAALYKRGLSEDKLGRRDASRKTLQELVRRFPQSGEAQLARDLLASPRRR